MTYNRDVKHYRLGTLGILHVGAICADDEDETNNTACNNKGAECQDEPPKSRFAAVRTAWFLVLMGGCVLVDCGAVHGVVRSLLGRGTEVLRLRLGHLKML